MNFEWKGVFPALLTPFTKDDQLDIPLFEKNLHLLQIILKKIL